MLEAGPAATSGVLARIGQYVALASGLGIFCYVAGWVFYSMLLWPLRLAPEDIRIDSYYVGVRAALILVLVAVMGYLAVGVTGVARHLRRKPPLLSRRVKLVGCIAVVATVISAAWGTYVVLDPGMTWPWRVVLAAVSLVGAGTLLIAGVGPALIATGFLRRRPQRLTDEQATNLSARHAIVSALIIGFLLLAPVSAVGLNVGRAVREGKAVRTFPLVVPVVEVEDLESGEPESQDTVCRLLLGEGDGTFVLYEPDAQQTTFLPTERFRIGVTRRASC